MTCSDLLNSLPHVGSVHLNIRCSVSSGDSGDTLRPVCLRSLLFDSVGDEVLLLLDFVVRRLVGFDDDDDGDTVEGLA